MFPNRRTRITDRIRTQLIRAAVEDRLLYELDSRMITMIGYRGYGDVRFGEGITVGLLEFSGLCDVLLVSVDDTQETAQ